MIILIMILVSVVDFNYAKVGVYFLIRRIQQIKLDYLYSDKVHQQRRDKDCGISCYLYAYYFLNGYQYVELSIKLKQLVGVTKWAYIMSLSSEKNELILWKMKKSFLI